MSDRLLLYYATRCLAVIAMIVVMPGMIHAVITTGQRGGHRSEYEGDE